MLGWGGGGGGSTLPTVLLFPVTTLAPAAAAAPAAAVAADVAVAGDANSFDVAPRAPGRGNGRYAALAPAPPAIAGAMPDNATPPLSKFRDDGDGSSDGSEDGPGLAKGP